MTYDERINKAIEFYKEAADEDSFAQYRCGIYLLENGNDCVRYFQLSANQRCWHGIHEYCIYLDGDMKKFYLAIQIL